MKLSTMFLTRGAILTVLSPIMINAAYYYNDKWSWEVATWSLSGTVGLIGIAFLIVGGIGIWIDGDVGG